MEKKTCTKCKQEKPIDCFKLRNKKSQTRQSWCIECLKTFQREKYQQEDSEKRRIRKNRFNLIQRNYEFVFQYLSDHSCIDCGETNPIVLQFDHNRDKKIEVSRMIHGHSLEEIQKEIEKCDIRCANCHLKKTAKDFKWYQKFSLERFLK